MEQLELENQRLRQQLQALVDEARVNEKKWRRLEQLEQKLISTHTLPDLIGFMLNDYKQENDTEAVTLVLADPEHEIRRILSRSRSGEVEWPGLVLMEKFHFDEIKPHIGGFDAEHPRAIFDPWPEGCQSMILLPLKRQGSVIGSLNFASSKSDRFSPDSRTDFVERMVSILAICIENALNHERLKQVGLTDALTGVFNRRYFDSRCQEEIAYARRHHTPLSCMFLDIDHFKQINDSFGHAIGDNVLCEVAEIIKSGLRGTDVLARFGGEEFVVLLPRTTLQSTCEIAERIRGLIAAQPFSVSSRESREVTISIGVSELSTTSGVDVVDAAHQLLADADAAVYAAKGFGRNRVVSAPVMSANDRIVI